MMQKPRVTVGAIIEKNNNILLVKRNTEPFRGHWAIPGGHIDFGETAKQAVIREVKEETGLTIKPKFFRYFDEIVEHIDASHIDAKGVKHSWHAVVLVFSCSFSGRTKIDKHIDAKGVKQTGEITDLKWFVYNEIKKMKIAFKHKEILEEWIKTKK